MEGLDIVIKKAKGRPRKIVVESLEPVIPQLPKKRGRKCKIKVDEEPKVKRKRGRKAAVKYFTSSIRKKMPLTAPLQDNDKYILHLDIKDDMEIENKKEMSYDSITNEFKGITTNSLPEQLGKLFESKTTTNSSEIENILDELNELNINSLNDKDIIELYEKRLESRNDEDNNLINSLDNLHTDDTFFKSLINNTESAKIHPETPQFNSNIECRKKGFFRIFNDFIENDNWLHSTNVCCWWCCHTFDTIPLGLPQRYNVKISKFIVKGIFCTFGCMMAYNNVMKIGPVSLIKLMYFKLTGIINTTSKSDYKQMLSNTLDISLFDNCQELKDNYISGLVNLSQDTLQSAPPRCSLKMFGGELTIDEFRASFKEHKVYKMIEYPMSISRDYIESVDIENVKNINKNVFTKIKSFEYSTNILDDKKVEETQNRIKKYENSKTNVVTNNTIDRFLTF